MPSPTAPSPTRDGGALVLRIDDTDPARVVPGGEEAIRIDLGWLGVSWDEGPVRQSERGAVYAEALERALGNGAVRDPDGSVRLSGTTLARADGSATYQLATVADDLDLGITHIIRGSDHRPNEDVQQRIARALGGTLPEVIHHGLLLGDDGKKLSKRAEHSSVADLREEGIPAEAVRAYLDELGLPRHDVKLDLGRIHRLAIDAIAVMPDDELAAAADAPVELARALRGARTLVEAREMARQIIEPRARAARRRGAADARALRGAAWRRARAARRGRGARDRPGAEGGGRFPQASAPCAHGRRARAGAVDRRRRGAARRGAAPGRRGYNTLMAVRLYDSATRSLVALPDPPAEIGMYVCGPTVYQRAHIGNAVPFVIFAWLRNWLRERGYAVTTSTTSRT